MKRRKLEISLSILENVPLASDCDANGEEADGIIPLSAQSLNGCVGLLKSCPGPSNYASLRACSFRMPDQKFRLPSRIM